MSWISSLCEIYEKCEDQIGKGPSVSKMLLPIFHTTQSANVTVAIDTEGNYCKGMSEVLTDKSEMVTIIPCTEKSAGRTSGPIPHALADSLAYVAGDYVKFGGSDKKWLFKEYISNLSEWAAFPDAPKNLQAIYAYLRKECLIADLVSDGILFTDDAGNLLSKWEGETEKPAIFRSLQGNDGEFKTFVRFRVIRRAWESDDEEERTWLDRKLWEHYIKYQESLEGTADLCFVTGQKSVLALQAPRKIRNAGDGAKLISSNDASNFTYRGRFHNANQAAGLSRKSCEEAHNALKWLIARQGVSVSDKTIVAWNTAKVDTPAIVAGTNDFLANLLHDDEDVPYDTAEDYSHRLGNALNGYGGIKSSEDNVIIMGLDSATPGRLSIFYYQEMTEARLLENLRHWHSTCAWEHAYIFKKTGDEKKAKCFKFYGAPSPVDIAKAAYGDKVDEKLQKYVTERILPCISSRTPFPVDIMNQAVHRASRPESMEDWEYRKTLSIACALVRKVKNDKEGVDWPMALDENCANRSYLFGRLLACGENVESYAMYVSGEESRQTNAERLMARFSQKPASTWAIIDKQLLSYWKRLSSSSKASSAVWKKKQIEKILDMLGTDNFTDVKLDPVYLIGYASQKMAFDKNKSEKVGKDDEE